MPSKTDGERQSQQQWLNKEGYELSSTCKQCIPTDIQFTV
jgi:hypothetical protein